MSRDHYSNLPESFTAPVTKTNKVFHLYADGTNGSDSNEGYSSGDAKATLQAVFDLLPDMLTEDVIIHLSGVFDVGDTLTNVRFNALKPSIVNKVYIDGGEDTTVIAGPYTSTGGNTSTKFIGTSGLGLTPDQHAGYWIEILDGVLEGHRYLCVEHDAENFTPVKNFPSDPGAGVSYQIVRPTTEIKGYHILRFQNTSNFYFMLQRLYFNDSRIKIYTAGGASMSFIGVVCGAMDRIQTTSGNLSSGNTGLRSVDGSFTWDATQVFGLSMRSGLLSISHINVSSAGIIVSYLNNYYCSNSSTYIRYGTRIRGDLTLDRSWGPSSGLLANVSGFADTKVTNSTDTGIEIKNYSSVSIGTGVLVADNTLHGIEVDSSRLLILGTLSGTGNGGAGVYAHAHSFVTFSDGTTPTISGTVGEVSFDGTTEASTWAAIDAGTPATEATEYSSVKEL